MTEFSGPLSGIKVLDLTTVFMGPSATQMLGDLGADVIKVEAPGGDSTRTLGPNGEYGLGPLFLGLNRNKRSIVIDLKSAAGAELLLELTKSADVLATNIRPAAMARLGLGYARLAELNPQLIYASMVGFSQKGPYGPKAAYDDMMQAATGLAAVMGQQAEGTNRYRIVADGFEEKIITVNVTAGVKTIQKISLNPLISEAAKAEIAGSSAPAPESVPAKIG